MLRANGGVSEEVPHREDLCTWIHGESRGGGGIALVGVAYAAMGILGEGRGTLSIFLWFVGQRTIGSQAGTKLHDNRVQME